MLRTARWVPQREDPTDEDCASFHASRFDSARSSLSQVVKAWRKARLRVERGDPRALAAFRNLVLGLPAASGVVLGFTTGNVDAVVLLAIHARHFRPLTSSRRRLRLVAI